jgi:hypothetical protein
VAKAKRQSIKSLHRRLLAVEKFIREVQQSAEAGEETSVIGFRITQDPDDDEGLTIPDEVRK